MTAGGWAEDALGLLHLRVGETVEQVGDRFPLHADPADGHWTTTRRGSWTGGFWAGLLWLRARHTRSDGDRAVATAVTARLAPWAEADTATRGLILWYGTALATGDAAARALRERAAKAALGDLDDRLGLIPWGSALGGPRPRARVDGVPGLVPLLATAGPRGRAAAAAHLDRHLDLCLPRESGRRPTPAWRWEPRSGWGPEPDPRPGWTRGEAWLLLAVADGLLREGRAEERSCLSPDRAHRPWDRPLRPVDRSRPSPDRTHGPTDRTHGPTDRSDRLPDRLGGAAEQLLDSCAFLTGPLVPPARAHHPDGPLDTSAAAITAVALLKLALVPGAAWASGCADRAEAVLHRLAHAHLTRPGGVRPAGMLLDGCYDPHSGTAVRHELVWGDFFLALGLSALLGRVDLRRV
ncbi:sugar ABC transporter permease [Streptomyces sp. NPDC047971]|uniref:sugar ABC transporter permease n=1 Tax=Streptomyces sp. NPDC047971 TaxID=3154499 RepID=UPI0033CB0CBB